MQIVSKKYVPIPIAKRIVEETLETTRDNPIVARTYEYLIAFSKCSSDAAEKAVEKLVKELGLREETAIMLINIMPETIDEARPLFELEKKLVETQDIERALEILRESCGGD